MIQDTLDAYKTAIERNPADIWARNGMLGLLIRDGQFEEAKSILQAAILPKQQGARLALPELALCATRLGDMNAANRWAYEALAMPRENLRAYHKQALGRVFAMLGKSALASEFYERSEQLDVGGRHDLALIVDPGLKVNTGHHANYTLFFWHLLQRLADEGEPLSPMVLCGEPIPAGSDLATLEVAPVLAFEPYTYDKFRSVHDCLNELNSWFEHDLVRLELDGRIKLVMAHSMRAMMIAGFAAWLDRVFRDRSGVAVVSLIELDHLLDDDAARDRYREIYKSALTLIAMNSNVRPILYVETDIGRQFVESLNIAGLDVHVFPYLAASLGADHATPVPQNDRLINLGIVGDTRHDRGLQFFPRLIEATQDLSEECHWKLQLNEKALLAITDDEDAGYIEALGKSRNVSIVEGTLTSGAYFTLLDEIDVVVLPYLSRYAVSGSGVFYESLYMGKFLLVSPHTFMPDILEKLGHPHRVLEELTQECLEENVRWVVREKENIKRQTHDFHTQKNRQYPSDEFYRLLRQKLADASSA